MPNERACSARLISFFLSLGGKPSSARTVFVIPILAPRDRSAQCSAGHCTSLHRRSNQISRSPGARFPRTRRRLHPECRVCACSQPRVTTGRQQRPRVRWLAGYVKLIEDRVKKDGWNAYFVTFMFNRIPGGRKAQLGSMADALYRFYATFLTRVVRNPHSAFQLSQRPLFVSVPDYPVPKHDKQRLCDIAINDGLHMHGILVVPWQSRMKEDVISHLQRYSRLYVKEPLRRINIEEIEDNLGRVGDYVFKSVKRGRCSWDDVVILPKERSELRPTSETFRLMVQWIELGLLPPNPPDIA